ncbi:MULTISPECIES: hypothetical protein [unclassified Chelatococcus]|uniref:hypothetical protein n=1 Tax=unclassified Chelatococcus TaxID=2638111 RepID=UPI001BD0EC26|nr:MULTISPECIES: hypothetical protein [unclassified Chelatococcus]MBS7700156.1 hypothetical protein [Chelatococcus sp. YT9]MBX3556849.1 hypothetical protein [Chelatococcus sp.]
MTIISTSPKRHDRDQDPSFSEHALTFSGAEPTLEEMLADSIVQMMMRSDKIDIAEMWLIIHEGRKLLPQREVLR